MSSAGIPENPLRRFSTSVFPTLILLQPEISLKAIRQFFVVLQETKVLQKTLTSMGTQLREHSKCQME